MYLIPGLNHPYAKLGINKELEIGLDLLCNVMKSRSVIFNKNHNTIETLIITI